MHLSPSSGKSKILFAHGHKTHILPLCQMGSTEKVKTCKYLQYTEDCIYNPPFRRIYQTVFYPTFLGILLKGDTSIYPSYMQDFTVGLLTQSFLREYSHAPHRGIFTHFYFLQWTQVS